MPSLANPVERRPIDPSLPADTPLEPGVGASRGRQPVTAAERIAASEAVLGGAGQNPEPDAKANFIAAARRAAQAAANMSTPPADSPPAVKQGGSRLGQIAQKITGRRLVMVVLGSVIAGGTTHILTNVHSPKELWQLASTQVTGLQQSLLQTETTTKLAAAAKKAAKPVETAAASKPAGEARAPAPPPPQTAAPPQTASVAPSAPTTTPEPSGAGEPTTTATVSPLTIASIKLPTDVTGAIGKQTKFNQLPAQLPPADAATVGQVLPTAFGAALKAAALADDPAAEYEIGMRYAEGRGVPVNLEEAAHWLERAAARDLVPAQYRLGSLYEKGQGVKKDLEKARQLYRLAADRGNAKAMHNLAVLHAEGLEGKPDFKSAAHWFRRAADAGVADSQYNLGIMLARGLGIEQNLSESYKWFALAAQRSDGDAAKKRDDVAARLDQQALGIAKLAVQSFSPEAQPDEAINVKAPAEGWDKASAAAVKGRGKPAPARRSGA
jgi:localization factor PodJL